MKQKLHTFLLITMTLFSSQAAQAGEMRLWKSKKGSSIKTDSTTDKHQSEKTTITFK